MTQRPALGEPHRPAPRPGGRSRTASLLLVLAALVLLPVALWLAVYFLLNSSYGQDALRRAIAERLPPGALTFGAVGFGPGLSGVRLADAVVRDRSGREAITAGALTADLAWGVALGDPLRLDRVRAHDYGVHLAWDAAGQFSLRGAFQKGELPPPVPRDPKAPPKRPKEATYFEDITLVSGVVTLDWPAWGLRFADVDAKGAVRITPETGLEIVADLKGARPTADLVRAGRRVAYETVAIDGFHWLDQGFRADGLTLLGPDGARIALAGAMDFTGGAATLDATGDLTLAGAQAETLIPGWLPGGASLTGLVARLADKRLEASGALAVPELAGGPVGATALAAPLKLALEPGTLGVAGKVELANARAERLSGPDGLEARDVRLGRLEATVGSGVDALVEGLSAAALKLPDGEVGVTKAEGRLTAGLGGGKLNATVVTTEGRVVAVGDIDVGLISRKVEATIDLTLEALTKTLAASVLVLVPEAERERLGEPVSGTAHVVGVASQTPDETGKKRWGLRFELERADLSRGPGGERLVFADGQWTAGADAAPDGGPASP